MEHTIFKILFESYCLKIPLKKYLPVSLYPQIQTLALKFLKYFIQEILIIVPIDAETDLILNKASKIQESLTIKEIYQNIFYRLPKKTSDVMDFIGCIISLLGERIMSKQTQHLNYEQKKHHQLQKKNRQRLNIFFSNLKLQGIQLQQYLICMYFQITISQKISILTARSIIKKFVGNLIGSSNSNFSSQMKFLVEWQKVKLNLRTQKSLINQKRTQRNITHSKGYKYQIKKIFKQNLKQIKKQKENQLQNDRFILTKLQNRNMKNRRKTPYLSNKDQNSLELWENNLSEIRQQSHDLKVIKKSFSPQIFKIAQSKNKVLSQRIYTKNKGKYREFDQQLQQSILKTSRKVHHKYIDHQFKDSPKKVKATNIDKHQKQNFPKFHKHTKMNAHYIRKNKQIFERDMQNLKQIIGLSKYCDF